MWQVSNEIRHLSSLRTHRGQMRFLKGAQGGADDAVAKYKNGIEALKEIVDEVRHNRPSTRNEQFIVFHASNLKTELMEQGHASITQIFGNLIKESKKELQEFLAELKDTVAELTQVCETKFQFKRNQDKWMEVNNRKGEMQGKIDPIKKKFEFIMDDNYSDIGTGTFELTEQDKAALASIDQAWKDFQLGMADAKDVIRKCQADFKADMEERIDEFKREVGENREAFRKHAPFYITKEFETENNKKAFDTIQQYQTECKQLRDREEEMQIGLEIFNIEATKYAELAIVEKENSALLNIWTIKQEFDHEWERWKVIHFRDLDFKEMEETANGILDKVDQLNKEERKWKVSESIHERIYTFLSTLPYILQLSDESMRDRHWKELRIEVKEDFEENSPEFTLEKIYSLNLLSHEDKINDLCSNARAQLKIEKSLDKIEDMWERSPQTNLEIDTTYTKGSNEPCHKIANTENIITLIEEHSGELAKHKSSQFYKQFDDKIDMWENNIAKITETLEILTTV